MLIKSIFLALTSFAFVIPAYADDSNIYIGASIAYAHIHESSYEDDTSDLYPVLGYNFSPVYIEAGFSKVGSFKLKNTPNTNIDVEVFSTIAGMQFNLTDNVTANIHGGSIFWQSEATLWGNIVGDDSDTSYVLGFGLSRYLTQKKLSFRVQIQHLYDISGTDFSLLSVGINYQM